MGKATDKCRKSVMVLGFTHPHFLLIHQRIRDMYVEQKGGGGAGTMAMSVNGRITVDPDFVEKMDKDELAGVLAHEMLHLVMLHHGRRGGRDPWQWNIATDMCINKALQHDQIKLPRSAVLPPSEYNGDLYAEAVYEWLDKNPKHMPSKPKNGQGDPTAGCALQDDPNATDEEQQTDWRQVAIEARAVAQAAGKGTAGVAALLAPRQQKINWKKVVRHGFELACAKAARDFQTFAKRNRRSPSVGPQLPGWLGFDPRLAVVLDVSGSMDREWLNEIVSETKGLMKAFPGVTVYLVSHTSEVVWEGWLQAHGNEGKLSEAVSFSGGTDPTPAYEAVKKAGRFDTLIHFTDCEFGITWPEVPAKRLVVGAFLRSIATQPPPGAHVIPCGKDQ